MKLVLRAISISQGGYNMKDEDFYFEETSTKSVKRTCLIIGIVLIILVGGFIYASKTLTFNLKKDLEFEIGSKISKNVKDYVTNEVIDEDDYLLIFNEVSLDEDGKFDMIGDFNYRVKYKSIVKKGILHVVDTKAPEVELVENKIGVDEEIEPSDFLASCEDYSMPCTTEILNEKDIDTSSPGTYDVKLSIKDQFGNEVKKTAKLVVEKGYSKEKERKSDLKITHYSENFDDWNDTYILKFNEALTLEELEANEDYHDLIERATSENNDLNIYVPEEYKLNKVMEFNIIEAYNKYDYCVAVAIRVKLDNGKTLYLTK